MGAKEVPSHLRWACRRGMLELDIMLGKFLENTYLTLPSHEQKLFELLLEQNDQDLFYWLTGKEKPENPDLFFMVEKIREFNRR